MMKLTCHELEGLGDLRLIGVGFRNGHFDRGDAERTETKRSKGKKARSRGGRGAV